MHMGLSNAGRTSGRSLAKLGVECRPVFFLQNQVTEVVAFA